VVEGYPKKNYTAYSWCIRDFMQLRIGLVRVQCIQQSGNQFRLILFSASARGPWQNTHKHTYKKKLQTKVTKLTCESSNIIFFSKWYKAACRKQVTLKHVRVGATYRPIKEKKRIQKHELQRTIKQRNEDTSRITESVDKISKLLNVLPYYLAFFIIVSFILHFKSLFPTKFK